MREIIKAVKLDRAFELGTGDRHRLILEWHETVGFGKPKDPIAICHQSEKHLWEKIQKLVGWRVLLHLNGDNVMGIERDLVEIVIRRIYITGWYDKETLGMRTPVEVTFSFNPEEAHAWPSREVAESQCPVFDSYGVKVPWAAGGEYVCKDFQVAGRDSGEFIIYCDGPFSYRAAA